MTIEQLTIPLRSDSDGVLRVGTTRVSLETLIDTFRAGSPAEAIVDQFPSLQLADVYAVLSYYLRHRDEVDAYLRDRANDRERSIQSFVDVEASAALRQTWTARREAQDQ